jgi:hypothetical protein
VRKPSFSKDPLFGVLLMRTTLIFVSFVTASLCVVCFFLFRARLRLEEMAIPPVAKFAAYLRKERPEWTIEPTFRDTKVTNSCYILAPGTTLPSHKVPGVFGSPLQEINKYPFEKDAWKGTVFMRSLIRYQDSDKQGRMGHIFISKDFLFYGDETMLDSIEKLF